MSASLEVAQTIEAFDGQCQAHQQPMNQQAVGVVVGQVFEAIAILPSLKPCFRFTTTLGRGAGLSTKFSLGKSVGQ